MALKLPRTTRLDPSDTFVFAHVAEPGEWAVTGTFLFYGVDPARLEGKERQAFRAGFLGIESFGWSTLAVVTEASASERAAAVERLAAQLVARCGAPDLGTARAAAEEEVAFAKSLCDHPPETLLGLQRAAEGESVPGVVRHPAPARQPDRADRRLPLRRGRGGGARGGGGPGRAGAKGAAVRDFWVASGHHLLDRDEAGRLRVTDAFLKAYLARPELVPPEDACEAELRLHHELLMHHPRRPVRDDEIAAMADPDARENWRYMIALRDRLLAAPTLDAAYVALARGAAGETPPLFMNQLAQVVLRSALDRERDPWVLRAAELFYRPQRVSFHEGAMLLADAETIELHEQDRHASPLLAMFDGPAVSQLEILDEANAEGYFARSDAFDMVLDFGMGGAGRRGLAAAMAAWVRHLLAVEVEIEPVDRVEDENWAWFVGLDAEATRIGNALWNGGTLKAEAAERVVALFRLGFADVREVRAEVGAGPVWLILAMTADMTVRMKPQNLIAGLPLRAVRAS